ncbi:hypothetical protein [Campylobacter curvus]|uniref:hypothetical protein n=1 Tax=Campylobacter curvus TaxID=200 RepID=UPI001470440D|nr:hypothetical protein [Campylobacter curvus]
MSNKRAILNDLKIIRKNKKKEEIKQACLEVLFPEKATLKECKLLIEKSFSVKLSNKEFSKWRKEYEATNVNQPSDACHILVPKEYKKEDEELNNGTNNQE